MQPSGYPVQQELQCLHRKEDIASNINDVGYFGFQVLNIRYPTSPLVIKNEQFIYARFQSFSNVVGQPQGRVVFTLFEKYDCLSSDPYYLSQFLLGYIVFSSKFFYPVSHISIFSVDLILVAYSKLYYDALARSP